MEADCEKRHYVEFPGGRWVFAFYGDEVVVSTFVSWVLVGGKVDRGEGAFAKFALYRVGCAGCLEEAEGWRERDVGGRFVRAVLLGKSLDEPADFGTSVVIQRSVVVVSWVRGKRWLHVFQNALADRIIDGVALDVSDDRSFRSFWWDRLCF